MANSNDAFYAVIDIGTNSALLVISELEANGLKNVIQKTFSVRLGEGLSEDQTEISEASLLRLDQALLKYSQTLNNTGVKVAQVLLTEAVRKSSNPEAVYEIVAKRIGVEPETLTGDQEAIFAWLAIAHHYDDDQFVALDIGAGSSELASKSETLSLPLGALSLSQQEGAFPGDAVLKRLIKELKTLDLKKFAKRDLVISGGTASALVMCLNKMPEFNEELIEGYVLEQEALLNFLQLIMGLNIEVLSQMPGLDDKRSEIFISGVRILQAYIAVLKPKSVKISTFGVRRGALVHQLKLFERPDPEKKKEKKK